MDIKEVASLLGLSVEKVKMAIEDGVLIPGTETKARLQTIAMPGGIDVLLESVEAFVGVMEKAEPGRHPPIAVRRELLIEVGYRCGICRELGPMEFHHIVDWAKIKHHDPEHMLAVCANCHARITRYSEPDAIAQKKMKSRLRDQQKAAVEATAQLIVRPLEAVSPSPSPASSPAAVPASSPATVGAEAVAVGVVAATPISTSGATSFESFDFGALTGAMASFNSKPAKGADESPTAKVMRQIFAKEVGYMAPSDADLEKFHGTLFSGKYDARIPNDVVLLLRSMRAVVQIRTASNPEQVGIAWVHAARLVEIVTSALAEIEADVLSITGRAEAAFTFAKEKKLLQFSRVDEWEPGMASGSGWVDIVASTRVAEKLLEQLDR